MASPFQFDILKMIKKLGIKEGGGGFLLTYRTLIFSAVILNFLIQLNVIRYVKPLHKLPEMYDSVTDHEQSLKKIFEILTRNKIASVDKEKDPFSVYRITHN